MIFEKIEFMESSGSSLTRSQRMLILLIAFFIFPIISMGRTKDDEVVTRSSKLIKSDFKCFEFHQIKDIAKNFTQVNELIPEKYVGPLCTDIIGARWTILLETLLYIKEMKFTIPDISPLADDLSRLAYHHVEWWAYFTARITTIIENAGGCEKNVYAQVSSVFHNNTVYICDAFYEQDLVSRVSYLLHEATHATNDKQTTHVYCERGNARNDLVPACDKAIQNMGSYAIQAQALSQMALFDTNLSEKKKAIALAAAVDILENRFINQPLIEYERSLYVEDFFGKVFYFSDHDIKSSRLIFLKKIPSRSRLYTSRIEIILFPENSAQVAYRTTADFKFNLDRLGMFAGQYNQAESSKRRNYYDFSYSEQGGVLTNSELQINCYGSGKMTERSVDTLPEKMVSFFDLGSKNYLVDKNSKNLLRSKSGLVYSISCRESGIDVQKTNWWVSPDIKKIVIVGDQLFALTRDGVIGSVQFVDKKISLERIYELPFRVYDISPRIVLKLGQIKAEKE